jgi:DNA-binding CsgD family transcriptional regulator
VSGATSPTWVTVGPLLEELLVDEVGCAPHVLSRLIVELGAHTLTIRQVATALTRAQRQGLLPLPSPLPIVPAIADAFRSLDPAERDRALLIAVSVTLTDELAPILAFDGRSAEQLATSAIGALLHLHAGRIRLKDPRLAVWIRDSLTPGEAAHVHARLREVFIGTGRETEADWHRARASLEMDPVSARELTRIARGLSEAGDADRALTIAREAAAHAAGRDLDEARLVAGAAAIGAGYALEAAAWLGSLVPHGTERYRLQGLAGLLIAQAHLLGSVPEIDPSTLRPASDAPEDWYSVARGAALAVPLCAERGDRQGMRTWRETLRYASSRVGVESKLRDPAVALAWLLVGESDKEDAEGTGPVTGGLLRALTAALDGRIDVGLRLLAHEDALASGVDPLVEGFERSPLVDAYRAVAHALLLVWRGDMGEAREHLLAASMTLPVSMPFAGLGVVLARRLDLAVLGELGPFARALTGALPAPQRIDLLIDQGIEAFLGGDFDAAAGFVRLWRELGAPQTSFAVPGLEEIRPGGDEEPAVRLIEPPEVRRARSLRTRVATAPDVRWHSERDEVLTAARTLRSPFARGRIEAMLGTRAAIRGEAVLAREHLRTAHRLFELSGAHAWARSVVRRIATLDADDGSSPIDPLAACRAAWSQQLTARELEVAMRAAAGASNREISEALVVSVRTVEVHIGRAFAKLGVRSRVELTVLAHRTNQLL